MISSDEILLGIVVPATLAATIILFAPRLRVPGSITWVAAITLGWITGQAGTEIGRLAQQPTGWEVAAKQFASHFYNPTVARDWLPLGIAMVAVVSLLDFYLRGRLRWISVCGRIAVCGYLPARMLWTSVYCTQQWSPSEQTIALTSLSLALFAIWCWSSNRPAEDGCNLRAVAVCLVLIGLAVTLATSAGRIYGQLAVMLAAIVATSTIAAAVRSGVPGSRAATSVITVGAANLLVLGHYFASLPALHAIGFAVSLCIVTGPFVIGSAAPGRLRTATALALGIALAMGLTTHSTLRFLRAIESQSANPYLRLASTTDGIDGILRVIDDDSPAARVAHTRQQYRVPSNTEW